MSFGFKILFLFIVGFAVSSCSVTKAPLTPRQEADMLYAKASQLQDTEFLDEASAQFEEYARKYPESIRADNARLQIANSYLQQSKYEEAISAYNDVIEKYPDSDATDHALLSIGDAYLAQGEYSKAIEAYDRVIGKYPRFGVKVAFDARDRADAVKDIETDLKILSEGEESSKDNAQYDIAEIYFSVYNDYELARNEYQKVVDKWPKSELADDALWRIGDCYWNIASRQLPSEKFSDEQMAFVTLMEIYDKFPQLTKLKLFHMDAHWPAATKDVREYELAFAQTRRIINKYPKLADMRVIDFIPENYRKAFEKWEEVIMIYSHTDRAVNAPLYIAQTLSDLGNIYYNMGQKHFASLVYRESLLTAPTPEGHLGMARYYGNITSVSAPAWAYRRAFYHIKKAEELTPANSLMANEVSWAKEWMNYKMRIEGLENWPDKNAR